MEPSYLSLLRSGDLAARAEAAQVLLRGCALCPRRCGVNRLAGEQGACGGGARAELASWGAHLGEEACLSGSAGSGALFFSGCALQCVYCQNADISQASSGRPVAAETLAAIMLSLQASGCHNINLVTPTHFVPQVLHALAIAAAGGLRIPIVYNSSGYEAEETLRFLDGVVDVYMPDLKYMSADAGRRLSRVRDYPEVAQAAITEMHRQVGDLQIGPDRLGRRGLLVRHLVLPAGLAGSPAAARFLAGLSSQTFVNVMGQYRPCHKAARYPEINRRPTPDELQDAVAAFHEVGLTRGDGLLSR